MAILGIPWSYFISGFYLVSTRASMHFQNPKRRHKTSAQSHPHPNLAVAIRSLPYLALPIFPFHSSSCECNTILLIAHCTLHIAHAHCKLHTPCTPLRIICIHDCYDTRVTHSFQRCMVVDLPYSSTVYNMPHHTRQSSVQCNAIQSNPVATAPASHQPAIHPATEGVGGVGWGGDAQRAGRCGAVPSLNTLTQLTHSLTALRQGAVTR